MEKKSFSIEVRKEKKLAKLEKRERAQENKIRRSTRTGKFFTQKTNCKVHVLFEKHTISLYKEATHPLELSISAAKVKGI